MAGGDRPRVFGLGSVAPGSRIRFEGPAPARFRVEPVGHEPTIRGEEMTRVVELLPLDLHALLVGETR